MPSVDSDDIVGRRLRELPGPRAPQTLLPRVLAAAERWSRRPWYTRAWLTWPFGLQALSLATLALLLVGISLVIPTVQGQAADAAWRLTGGRLADLKDVAQRVDAVTNGCLVLWRALVEPLAPYAIAMFALTCLLCALSGTALNRFVARS